MAVVVFSDCVLTDVVLWEDRPGEPLSPGLSKYLSCCSSEVVLRQASRTFLVVPVEAAVPQKRLRSSLFA